MSAPTWAEWRAKATALGFAVPAAEPRDQIADALGMPRPGSAEEVPHACTGAPGCPCAAHAEERALLDACICGRPLSGHDEPALLACLRMLADELLPPSAQPVTYAAALDAGPPACLAGGGDTGPFDDDDEAILRAARTLIAVGERADRRGGT